MSVDDRSDDGAARADRPGDDETGADADAARRALADRPRPTALRPGDASLTIEFARESGAIRIRRETALGAYTESVDR
ncbi:hypothetical protein [Salinirubrum litoreum]|uniref:Uncharacterized protein n=1 Tax=Salinirubrum litoreum TaxID=1126234 RepID=A0ABD5R954_9EURY|nr:hypothetical protein [Salinirubrum litoreum]